MNPPSQGQQRMSCSRLCTVMQVSFKEKLISTLSVPASRLCFAVESGSSEVGDSWFLSRKPKASLPRAGHVLALAEAASGPETWIVGISECLGPLRVICSLISHLRTNSGQRLRAFSSERRVPNVTQRDRQPLLTGWDDPGPCQARLKSGPLWASWGKGRVG